MKPGALVAGRWKLTHELPGTRDSWRWACEDSQGQERAECVGLRPSVALWPGARESFAAGGNLMHEAALPVLARDVLDGVPVRVRPRTRGGLGRLSAREALAVAGWLGGAVTAGAGAAGGSLRGEDVVVGEDGVPRFAPLGVAPPKAVQANPWAPPERDTAPPDAAADLYGLGVLLHEAVGGTLPWPATTQAELERRRGMERPRLGDPALDGALDGLMQADPRRRSAPEAPAHAPVLAADAPTPGAASLALTPTSTADLLPSPSTVVPTYVVLVDTRALGPGALARLAVRSGCALEAVQEASRRGEA
jgi:hypothetical protein